VIQFESVGKTFRDGTVAVVDLSLTVPSGRTTVIVGPSGCGKTTTLRMVNRMIEPTSGQISWDGVPLRSKRRTALRRQMGYVIQSGGLFPHRTVVENIGTVPGLLGWSKAKSRARSLELLDAVGLDHSLAHRYPAQLSGGQQQRVGVARALAADPAVLLMDEPFSAVDPVVRGELHEFFLDLQHRLSKTIILITHDIDEAIKLGDQVAILRVGGTLAQVGTPQELLDEPADAFVEGFVGRDRGYRSLSFLPADSLRLERVQAVRDADVVAGDEPALVIDAEAHPVGWVDPTRPGQPLPLGSVFDPETDTLRAALDSALTSPRGLAVAVVKSTGRYAGVVSAEQILRHAAAARAAVAESIRSRAGAGDASTPTAPVAEPQPIGNDPTAEDGPSPATAHGGGTSATTQPPYEGPSQPQDHAGTADEDRTQPTDDGVTPDEDRAQPTDDAVTADEGTAQPADPDPDPDHDVTQPNDQEGTADETVRQTVDPAASGDGDQTEPADHLRDADEAQPADHRPGTGGGRIPPTDRAPHVPQTGSEPHRLSGAESAGLSARRPEDPHDRGQTERQEPGSRPAHRPTDPPSAAEEQSHAVDVLHLGELADVEWRRR
jgi:osmoprotectant transport system ATP-binding protein